MSTEGFEWMATSIDGYRTDSYGEDSSCKLPDRRGMSASLGLVLGFPLSLANLPTPSVGKLSLAAVAVDFPDFQGAPTELGTLRNSALSIDEWLNHESDGRLSATWQFHEEWITMSKPAADYRVQGFGTEAYQRLSTEIVDRVLEVLKLEEVDNLFVYFPHSITNMDQDVQDAFQSVLPQIGLPEREIRQFDRSRLRDLKGSGTISKKNGNVLWAIWAHDLLHTMGLQVHGPEASGLIDNESNGTFTVSAWNRWILGWLDDRQVACLTTVTDPVEVDLVPLQVDAPADGIQAVMVPLSETTALLVESHRAVGYGENKGFGKGTGIGRPGAYGIVAYFIDSAETAPYDPTTMNNSIGTRFLFPEAVVNGERGAFGSIANPGLKSQPLTFLGERILEAGYIIEFIASSGYDTIRVSKG